MEKMPYQEVTAVEPVVSTVPLPSPIPSAADWRTGLPTLIGSMVTLRELRLSDAPSLFVSLTTDEVARFISPPPTTLDGFERFIGWAHRQRAAGQYICFAVVARTSDIAIGLFQQLVNPLGEGIGAAGVYAGNYSMLSLESAVLNTANQITLLGLVLYVLILVPGLRRGSPLQHEMRLMAAIFALTALFAPQIFVIKSTFAFFFFLGANAALSERSLAVGHRHEARAAQRHVGQRHALAEPGERAVLTQTVVDGDPRGLLP